MLGKNQTKDRVLRNTTFKRRVDEQRSMHKGKVAESDVMETREGESNKERTSTEDQDWTILLDLAGTWDGDYPELKPEQGGQERS